jgi:predicted aldo/keto reductase-like oxidoreductase
MLDNVRLHSNIAYPDVVPLVGIEKTWEIEEIVGLLDKPRKLTKKEKTVMDKMIADLGAKFCRRCDYCQPCTADIAISTVMNIQPLRMPPERSSGGWLMPCRKLTTAQTVATAKSGSSNSQSARRGEREWLIEEADYRSEGMNLL